MKKSAQDREIEKLKKQVEKLKKEKDLKSATKPFNVLLACTRPLVTEFADN